MKPAITRADRLLQIAAIVSIVGGVVLICTVVYVGLHFIIKYW